MKDYDPANEEVLDIIGGVAGAIVMLSNIYQIEKDIEIKRLIEKYADFLVSELDKKEDIWTGFSHGLAGYALALRRAAMICENDSFIELAISLEEKEDSYYDPELLNWLDLRDKKNTACNFWCHGAPGILLERSYALDREEFYQRYNDALEKLKLQLSNDVLDDISDSLCHGCVGNLEIVDLIANNTDNMELKALIESWRLLEEKKLEKFGIEYGIPQLNNLKSFMLGSSGVGYSMLRMRGLKIPSVLGLEVV